MTTAIEKDTDMSNEPIYPLDEHYWHKDADEGLPVGRRRTVNHRLTPIFRAMADDPDGWELEVEYESGRWKKANRLPLSDPDITDSALDYIRLVPKRRTISVEMGKPVACAVHGVYSVLVNFATQKDADQALEAIRKAMEGK